MQVHWTRRALRRLGEHANYIALRSPQAADEMIDRIFDTVDSLGANPLMGREGRYIGTRELVIERGRYVVIYRMRGQVIQVVTIHDTRQQWPTNWKDA